MLKKLLFDYLHTSTGKDFDTETNRKLFTVNLFGLVGLTITGVMGFGALFEQRYWLAAVLIFASMIFYLGHYYQKITGNYLFASNVILYSLLILMTYLIYSGGKDNTGPLWIFMVAPVALFFGGLKRGLMDISAFVLIISLIMFFPGDQLIAASYSFEFKTRLLFSFLTITFLSAFYEYSRQQSFTFMCEMSQKYEQLAKLDPLTQLSNRRDALEKLDYEMKRLQRNNYPMALVLCDIDLFKQINDKYGHDAGDHTLILLAELFKETLRKQDTIARWGGEEFLFILPQTTSKQAQIVADKLRNRIKSIGIEHNGNLFEVSVSMGISELTKSQNNVQEAISRADEYLYVAKEKGRDQVQPNMDHN